MTALKCIFRLKTLSVFLFMIGMCTNNFAQTNNDSLYTIGMPGALLEIDASKAGRISSLKIAGKEFLYVNKTADNWGSTFWTSPQSAWGWPPLENINSKPYAGSKKNNVVTLKGSPDPKLGLSVQKEFKFNQKDTSFNLRYILVNTCEKAVKVAPWEITRVLPGGLTIFPTGNTKPSGLLAPLMKDSCGSTWFKYEAQIILRWRRRLAGAGFRD
jgi:hypothetical protein